MPGKLKIEPERLISLMNLSNGPIYVYDEVQIRNNAKLFMETFKKYMPKFKQYFAVKATPNKHIMDILCEEGMGFDCSSLSEITLVGQLNRPTEIIYSSNYTSVDDCEELLCSIYEGIIDCDHDEEIKIIINLDDIDCLENLIEASLNTKLPLPDTISFRLNPLMGTTNSETQSNILGGQDSKFGIPTNKIIEAYARAITVGFKKFGIHVMTGSCVLDVNYFKELVDVVFDVVNKIHSTLSIDFDFVDLGGGIGIPYKPEQEPINLDSLAKTISEQVQHNIKLYNLPFEPTIAMENGRFITGPFGWLVTQCKSIKNGFNDVKFYGLNASMANLMRPGMYGAYHHIYVPRLDEDENERNIREECNVVGSLCENNDWFAKNRSLPKNIKKNDVFVICDTGAHGFSMGFQYNGKTRSAEWLYNSEIDKFKIIRCKETHPFN